MKELPTQYHKLLNGLKKAAQALANQEDALARALLTAVRQAEDHSLPVCCYMLFFGAEAALEAMDAQDPFSARIILKIAMEDAEKDRRLCEDIGEYDLGETDD